AGTVSEKQNYSALDPQPYPGTSYYRLKQTDFDGNASFSPVEKVELTTVNPIQVFPNPSDGVFYITGPKLNAANIKVLNGLGQEVFPGIMEGSKLAIDLRPLAPGLYILKAWDGTSLHSVRMVKK
ncbi:MAG: T9SS type A sorting domain-containing protein, partial [Flammeovirgaceae bacterium]|nr:T9SS type A sorting domain-containing protein [Flammeovirgaceae bacterium]